MNGITVHCIVKNEERWIWYALMSVIDSVDRILIYDTGSTDNTIKIIKTINNSKIELSEIGNVGAKQFTKLRNNQLKETKTDWIMILDGDEIWNKETLKKMIDKIKNAEDNTLAAFVHYFEFVKDIYHYYMGHEQIIFPLNEKRTYGWYTIRFIKNIEGLYCGNDYGSEGYFTLNGNELQRNGFENYIWADDIYYFHTRNLLRSSSEEKDKEVMQRVEKRHQHKIGKIPKIYRSIEVKYPEVFKIELKTGCRGIGDELIMSGVAKILKKNSFNVKLSITSYPELFKNNPNIDELVVLDKINCRYRLCDLKDLLLKFGIIREEQIYPEIYLTNKEIKWGKDKINKIKDSRFLVAFVPHSKKSPANLSEGWDKIIDSELNKKMQFIYFGQENYNRILNFNTYNLRQIASLIRNCQLYIGINTGLYHLSKCFGLRGFVVNRFKIKDHWGYNDDIHVEDRFSSYDFLTLIKKNFERMEKNNETF